MFFFFQAEDGIRDGRVTGVQTCALPISYGGYYYVSFFNSNDRYLNFANIDNALLVTGTAAAPVCISGPPCRSEERRVGKECRSRRSRVHHNDGMRRDRPLTYVCRGTRRM